MSRTDRRGKLILNDDEPVEGQSGGTLNELNLPMKMYVGGFHAKYNPEAGIVCGFFGAIQRVSGTRRVRLKSTLAGLVINVRMGLPGTRAEHPVSGRRTWIG